MDSKFTQKWYDIPSAAEKLHVTVEVVKQALLMGDLTPCVIAQNWFGNWVPTVDGEPFTLRGRLEDVNLPTNFLLNAPVDANEDGEPTLGKEDLSDIEPDWEALDPFEAMPDHPSVSENDIDKLDIVMWQDPIQDGVDEFIAFVWRHPGDPLCYVLYEFRARGLWRLPSETVHEILPAGETTTRTVNHLTPFDPVKLAIQEPMRVSQEGSFWIKEKDGLPTVSTAQIVIPATEVNPAEVETNSHPKATLKTTRKVLAALAFALARESKDCAHKDGKPKPGQSEDTGDSGIVGYLLKNKLTSLGDSTLHTYISKAIKDFPPPTNDC